jgi:hypothetical protein
MKQSSDGWEQAMQQIFIQKEIKSRLNTANSIQTYLSSHLPSKIINIKIYKIIILSVVLYGYETWSLTLREEHREQGAEENI